MDIEVLKRQLERYKRSQKEAEQLLEKKSEELYLINKNLEKEVHRRAEAYEKARDEAIAANQAKSQFLANMSHEIRTPLNGMLGYIDLLSQSSLSTDQKEQVEIIHKSGQLLLSLISDILDFSKIEANKLTLENKSVQLKELTENVLDLLKIEAQEKKHKS